MNKAENGPFKVAPLYGGAPQSGAVQESAELATTVFRGGWRLTDLSYFSGPGRRCVHGFDPKPLICELSHGGFLHFEDAHLSHNKTYLD